LNGESAGADKQAALEFVRKFAGIVKEGTYFARQVVSVDKTGIFWKEMSARISLTKE
jgi:hypothetical protein